MLISKRHYNEKIAGKVLYVKARKGRTRILKNINISSLEVCMRVVDITINIFVF